jgi:tRNA threonylcarbamoyladenosine biosynthesis protein TsaE
MWTVQLNSLVETRSFGEALGRVAAGGLRVALEGDLGAGKTSFAQGVGLGLALDTKIVSPTFILMAEYEGGRLPLLHGDAYRLGPDEAAAIGMDETIDLWPGVVLLEWSNRVPGLIGEDRITVSLSNCEGGRLAQVSAEGDFSQEAAAAWRARYCE